MARTILRVLIIFASLAIGWAAAKAQTSDPDFVLSVDAPAGATTITCVKGCAVKWVERGINPQSGTMAMFSYSCTHPAGQNQVTSDGMRCLSGKIGGWITH